MLSCRWSHDLRANPLHDVSLINIPCPSVALCISDSVVGLLLHSTCTQEASPLITGGGEREEEERTIDCLPCG